MLTFKGFLGQALNFYEYSFERKESFTRKFLCDHYYRCSSLFDMDNQLAKYYLSHKILKNAGILFYGGQFFLVLPECVGTGIMPINGNYQATSFLIYL